MKIVNRKILPFHAVEHHRNGRNMSLNLSERCEFLNSGLFREAQENLAARDQVNGCPFFWFVFFGRTKKMNVQKNTALLVTPHNYTFSHQLNVDDLWD